MMPTNDEGPSVRTAGPSENHTFNQADYPPPGPNRKVVATQIAQLALAGHVVHKGSIGDFTVCKYGLTRYCQDFSELQAFAQQLGIRQ